MPPSYFFGEGGRGHFGTTLGAMDGKFLFPCYPRVDGKEMFSTDWMCALCVYPYCSVPPKCRCGATPHTTPGKAEVY